MKYWELMMNLSLGCWSAVMFDLFYKGDTGYTIFDAGY
jgi:hypothetical protein